MAVRLTDSTIRKLPVPENGNRITYDADVKGLGCRVTASGNRAFILNYRTQTGRERRYTIGTFPEWRVSAARNHASELKRRIDRGHDPLEDLDALRSAPTMADLCARFDDEFLPKKRPSTVRDYRAIIKNDILPSLKHFKVSDITFDHVDKLHRKITKRGAPYAANRTVAVLSKMFTLAIKWKWRSENPAKGIERNEENPRARYLTSEELAALSEALSGLKDQQAANIVRLLLLTGARRGEVQAMRWADVDLMSGVWTKPGATTKRKTTHRVPLSAPARQLLVDIRKDAEQTVQQSGGNGDCPEFVFPGNGRRGHREEIKHQWSELCKTAGLLVRAVKTDDQGREFVEYKPSARLHDLRHTYASVLASSGLSLPIIGALLGHTQPATTARYAHLLDDPLRDATERASAIIEGRSQAEIIKLKKVNS